MLKLLLMKRHGHDESLLPSSLSLSSVPLSPFLSLSIPCSLPLSSPRLAFETSLPPISRLHQSGKEEAVNDTYLSISISTYATTDTTLSALLYFSLSQEYSLPISISQAINLSVNPPISQSIYQAINLSGNQSIRQSIYQAINLSGN